MTYHAPHCGSLRTLLDPFCQEFSQTPRAALLAEFKGIRTVQQLCRACGHNSSFGKSRRSSDTKCYSKRRLCQRFNGVSCYALQYLESAAVCPAQDPLSMPSIGFPAAQVVVTRTTTGNSVAIHALPPRLISYELPVIDISARENVSACFA